MSAVFKSFDQIEIDGVLAGNIVDVISNHGPRRAEVLAAFGVYVKALETKINAENDTLKTSNSMLTAALAAMTTERDAAISAKTQADATIARMDAEKVELKAVYDACVAQLDDALSKVRQYEDAIWDRRKIDPSAWFARLTEDQILKVAIAGQTDAIVASFTKALRDAKEIRRQDPTYLMSLDHPNAQLGLAYMSGSPIQIDANGNTATIATPIFTEEEAEFILSDSRRDEQ